MEQKNIDWYVTHPQKITVVMAKLSIFFERAGASPFSLASLAAFLLAAAAAFAAAFGSGLTAGGAPAAAPGARAPVSAAALEVGMVSCLGVS